MGSLAMSKSVLAVGATSNWVPPLGTAWEAPAGSVNPRVSLFPGGWGSAETWEGGGMEGWIGGPW